MRAHGVVALGLSALVAACGSQKGNGGDDSSAATGAGATGSTGGGGSGGGGTSGDGAGGTSGAGTSGAGGMGASGSGGTGGSTPIKPGVFATDPTTMMTSCVPLCTMTTTAAGSDFATENDAPCVIPGTPTDLDYQSCNTGQTLPATSVPGVVVADNTAGTTKCAPLCVVNTDPAADPEGDDWSYESGQSCVIPGTLTSHNQACMTGEAKLPPPDERPGILVNTDTSGVECVSLCRWASEPGVANSDWAYEDNASCLLPESPTATGRRDCTVGVTADFTPPALTGTKIADGFYVKEGRLFDAYGGDFVMRGVNNADAWFDGYAQFYGWFALDNIQSYGTNTVRVVWDTKSDPALLADVLHHIVELKMVPMVELHDTTGIRADDQLIKTAAWWVKPEVLAVLQQFRAYLLVNIANEWSGGDSYQATYTTVIQSLRDAGIQHTLVVDASGYGQNAQSLVDNAQPLLDADPEHNLLFSIHMYDLFTDPARVDLVLEQAVSAKIPYIVGEYGISLNGKDVAWAEIQAKCQALGLGYLAWSWMGNDVDTAQLDLAEGWEGPLTAWGEDVMNDPNGITKTAKRASIFE